MFWFTKITKGIQTKENGRKTGNELSTQFTWKVIRISNKGSLPFVKDPIHDTFGGMLRIRDDAICRSRKRTAETWSTKMLIHMKEIKMILMNDMSMKIQELQDQMLKISNVYKIIWRVHLLLTLFNLF